MGNLEKDCFRLKVKLFLPALFTNLRWNDEEKLKCGCISLYAADYIEVENGLLL